MDKYFELDRKQKSAVAALWDEEDARLSPYATPHAAAKRWYPYRKNGDSPLRPPFSIDVDKIVNNPHYSRYADKTQVFSLISNDDISRRSLHVQLVSRIARVIGRALRLNLDLIEAIALGHDIGHTPFGHKGETYLSELYHEHTKTRFFHHNVHSVRVLKGLCGSNLTLQTYDGILCHCGEKAFDEYRPAVLPSFKDFDLLLERCYSQPEVIEELRPATLEGCVVRISDMIAYIGKDRQDAAKLRLPIDEIFAEDSLLGNKNADIINKSITNIVKNSFGKDYLRMDKDVYDALCELQRQNNQRIYQNPAVTAVYENNIRPMMGNLYRRLREDFVARKYKTPIFQHHVNRTLYSGCYRLKNHLCVDADTAVTDYIAGMTDDYFIDLYRFLFPDDKLTDGLVKSSYF